MILLVASAAAAADCAALGEPGLRALVGEAKAAIDRDDLVSFGETRRTLLRELPCLDSPLPVDAWARFLFDDAVVAYGLGEPWESSLGTALSLDPQLPRTDLPEELRTWVWPVAVPGVGPLGPGEFLLDGRPITEVPPPLPGIHVAQRRQDGVVTTRVLRGAPFPADWQPSPAVGEPVERSRGRPGWIVAGVAGALVGAAVGTGTWAARGSVHDARAGDRLVWANVAGWSVAAVGVGVGGVGLALPVALRGSF